MGVRLQGLLGHRVSRWRARAVYILSLLVFHSVGTRSSPHMYSSPVLGTVGDK